MHWIYHTVRYYLTHWGYWAVLAGLLGENAGLPLPGETVLMFASFLAHKNTGLNLVWIIVVGSAAAIMGDNLGYLLGRKFGPTLIRWIKKILHFDDVDIDAAKDLMRRHGSKTVFFARYIFGLRTVAGPVAGMLGMEWKQFFTHNALGGVTWVTSMALIGYAFASQFQNLLDYFETAGWIIAAVMFTFGYLVWRRQKKQFRERHQQQQNQEGEQAA